MSLRKRLAQGQEGVKQSSELWGEAREDEDAAAQMPGPTKSCSYGASPKMYFQAKHQIFLPVACAFPCLSLPSYRNSSSSQEQIIKKLLFVCAYFKHCDNVWIDVESCEKLFKSQTY